MEEAARDLSPGYFALGLEGWRHVCRRLPLHYDPEYWGLVFPLGMYATCTLELGKATGLPFLLPISRCFTYVSMVAWTVTFIGLMCRLWASLVVSPVSRAEAS